MRFVNLDNRLTLVRDGAGIDVGDASGGRFPSSVADAFADWDAILAWARSYDGYATMVPMAEARVGAPSPRPAQIFAIGVNYDDHQQESGWDRPEVPMAFPKLLPAITGPHAEIVITGSEVDWEVELVIVIGRQARRVSADTGWDYVAGLTGGQDISDRELQMRPETYPQFSLGKSLPGYGPIGPALVTADEFADPDDIELACWINGEEVQRGRTSHLIYSIPELVAYLSTATTLLPGDVIFTGTPGGVGMALDPPRFLRTGDVVESYFEGIGRMSHRIVAEEYASDPPRPAQPRQPV